jgi:hypothetical protein
MGKVKLNTSIITAFSGHYTMAMFKRSIINPFDLNEGRRGYIVNQKSHDGWDITTRTLQEMFFF